MTQRNAPLPVSRAVFFVTVLGAFIVALDLSIVNVAFPSIRRSFPDATPADLSWVLSAYSVVFGALLLASGRVADRSGRRLVFFTGLAVFTTASVACGLAPDHRVLIAARVVQAAGAAMVMPSSLALLLGATPADARARVVALWGGVSALAVATGPSLGALIVQGAGWRAAFLVNIPVGLAAWLVGRRVLVEHAAGGPRPDLVGVAALSGAVAALALGITQAEEWGWGSPLVVAALAGAVVLGVAALRRSAHHPAPAIDLRIFESRTASLANAATLLYGVGFFAMLLGNILFLTGVWGWSTLAAGLAMTPGPLTVALLSSRTGRLAARVGFRPVLVTGSLLFAAGELAYLALVGPEPDYVGAWLLPSLLVGVGVAFTFPVLSAAAVSSLPPERFALGSAANQTSRQLGAVLGVALLVVVLGDTSGPDALDRFQGAWVFCAAMALASGAVSAFQRRPAAAPAAAVAVPAAAPVAVPAAD